MLTAGVLLPWSGGAFRYVGEHAGLNESAAQVPTGPARRVVDPIGLFEADSAARIGTAIDQARLKTGARIVVLTTRGLNGESFDRFTNRYHTGWDRGDGSNSAVIIFFSPADGMVGISTGNGLTIHPREDQRQAIVDDMKPLARAGEFEAAAMAAIKGIEDLLAPPADMAAAPATRT